MRFLSKCAFVYLMLVLCGGQKAYAGFMSYFVSSPAPAAPAQPIAVQASAPVASLHQMATQAPAHEVKTMREATQSPAQHDAPSLTLMAITYEDGKPCGITAPFTPEEIDKYPNHAARFFEHAQHSLESSNAHDVAAISYLVDKYPDFAQYLNEMAQRSKKINPSLKKHLFRASNPLITRGILGDIAQQIGFGYVGAWYQASGVEPHREAVLWDMTSKLGSNVVAEAKINHSRTLEALDLASGSSGQVNNLKILAKDIARQQVSFDRDVKKQEEGIFRSFYEALPRDVSVAVGTTVATKLLLREIEANIGDPLPCPKYDPKTSNVTRYVCEIFKKAVLPFVASHLVSGYVVAPAYDATMSAAQKVLSGSNT